jgi:RHS repeat-associated protein
VASTRRYKAFGAVRDWSGAATTERGFAGRPAEGTSGLVNLRARTYDPDTGSFLEPDPLGIDTDQLYAYAASNPYVYGDPMGLRPVSLSTGRSLSSSQAGGLAGGGASFGTSWVGSAANRGSQIARGSEGQAPSGLFAPPKQEFLPVTSAAVTCGNRLCDFSGNPSGLGIVSAAFIPPSFRAASGLAGAAMNVARVQGQFALGAAYSTLRSTALRVGVSTEFALTSPASIPLVRVPFRFMQGFLSSVSQGTAQPLTAPIGRLERAAFRTGEFLGEFSEEVGDALGITR